MDKRIVTFGRSGQFGSGHLSHFPGSIRKNTGLAGIVQPYQIYVQDKTKAGPYEERTHLSTDQQDPTNYSKTMKSTHYIKEGHGENSSDITTDMSHTKGSGSSGKNSEQNSDKSCQCENVRGSGPISNSASEIINEASKTPVKISQIEFKRKTSHLEEDRPLTKKKKSHKFNLV